MATDPGVCSRCCSPREQNPKLRSVKRKLNAMEVETVEEEQQQLVEVLARVEVENECYLPRETLASQQRRLVEVPARVEVENESYVHRETLASPQQREEVVEVLARVEVENECHVLSETLASPQQQQLVEVPARVEVENECHVLRETLASQQLVIQELYGELDEERNASSSAANEAMSMILRLQREKAEVQMEFRQFKRFAEEKMAHDQQQIAGLEDEVYKRELAIQALKFEVQGYRHRLLSLGVSLPLDFDSVLDCHGEKELGVDFDDSKEYPALKCHAPSPHDDPQQYVEVLESDGTKGNSPPRHLRRLSAESSTSFVNREVVQEYSGGGDYGKQHEEFPDVVMDHASDLDDVCERICTIDAVYGVTTPSSNIVSSPTGSGAIPKDGAKLQDSDIKNLYMRLQALEADREALKQTLVSLRADSTQNAQLILLREIAQNLSKGAVQHESERKLARKQSSRRRFPFMSIVKWLASFALWRRQPNHCKYDFAMSSTSVGLLLLLDDAQHFQDLRSVTSSRR